MHMKKIFIVHGWVYTTEKWDACLKQLREKGLDPVMLAVPGLTSPSDKAWTLAEYTDWLAQSLPASSPSIVVAHSNGGRIAISCAAKYPELFSKLILIGSAGIVHNELPIRAKRFVAMVAARVARPIVQSASLRAKLYRLIGGSDYGNANPLMRQTMAELIRQDLSPLFFKMNLPVTLIWGAKDTLTPLADGEKMKALFPNATLTVLEDAGHSPFATHPEKIAELIALAVAGK